MRVLGSGPVNSQSNLLGQVRMIRPGELQHQDDLSGWADITALCRLGAVIQARV